MKRHNKVSMAFLGIGIIITIFALGGYVEGATITINSLPFYAPDHTGDTLDILVIHPDSGGILHSLNHGIVFKDGHNSNWLIDLSGTDGIPGNADDHIIEFGTDETYFDSILNGVDIGLPVGGCGLITGPNGGSIGDNITVRGGYWLHRPDGITPTSDYGVRGDAIGSSYNFHLWHGCTNFHIDSVAGAEVRGFQNAVGDAGTHNVWARNSVGLRITGSRLYNHVYGWASRSQFHASNVKYHDPSIADYQSGNYTVRIEDSYLESQAHCGVVMLGQAQNGDDLVDSYITLQMVGCSLVVDQRNTFTQWQYVNGYAAMIHSIGGDSSYLTDNVFLAGSNYNGGRGMEMREWNTVDDTSSFYPAHTGVIEVSGNYFDMHQGVGSEFTRTSWQSCALKIRRGNHYSWVHDNVFINTIDTTTTENSGYSVMGHAVMWQFEMNQGEASRQPYHIIFENNICSLKVVTPTQTYYGSAIQVNSSDGFTEYDTTTKIRNNYFYSEGGIGLSITHNWDGASQYVFIENDTFEVTNSKGVFYGTVNQGHAFTSDSNLIRDCVYLGSGGPTSYSHRTALGGPTGDCDGRQWDWTSQRTLNLYAYGNNSLPVSGASCTVVDNYGDTVITGTTDASGLVTGIVDYFYHSRCSTDLAAYSPMTIKMIKGSDSTINATFTAGWIEAEGTDTLVLAATAGSGATINMKLRGVKP